MENKTIDLVEEKMKRYRKELLSEYEIDLIIRDMLEGKKDIEED
ncbi:MAG: hypothetical protein N4A64_00240 [Marinisporobacter sp.]|jgi:hypothetical protein|nr:hypothetical protein [Marinisporobacter sp.]